MVHCCLRAQQSTCHHPFTGSGEGERRQARGPPPIGIPYRGRSPTRAPIAGRFRLPIDFDRQSQHRRGDDRPHSKEHALEELDFYKAVPQFSRLRKDVLYEDVCKQPDLSSRDRSLVTCAILGALGKNAAREVHMKKAIENGATPDELRGLVVQLSFYAGWPCGVNSAKAGLAIFQADMEDK